MQMSNTPPGRKSISASGTAHPSGLNQRFMCSALLHALNTSSRGAAKVREITKGVAKLRKTKPEIAAALGATVTAIFDAADATQEKIMAAATLVEAHA